MTTSIATLSVITVPYKAMEYFRSEAHKQAENVGLKINGKSVNYQADAEYVPVYLFGDFEDGGECKNWSIRLPDYLVPAELVMAIQGADPTDEEYDAYSEHSRLPTMLPWALIKEYMDTPKTLHLTINGVDVACKVIHA